MEKYTKIQVFLDSLSEEERYAAYRYLWRPYVLEDVEDVVREMDVALSQNVIEDAADLFVDGYYDCNLSYWGNIERAIDKACEWRSLL